MRKILLIALALGIVGLISYWGFKMYQFGEVVVQDVELREAHALEQRIQSGDIIFQSSKSAQSKAIQLATHSPYSHMGIIYEKQGQYFVYEAVQPVRLTPLKKWIARGKEGHYVIKRLKNADQVLDSITLKKMRRIGEQYMGKPYDIYFEWSDDKMYCSELVWKIYQQATGIEIGALERLADFDLSHDQVKAKLKERYGDQIPLDEKVISPAAMFNSDKLMKVDSVIILN
ncbi:YiiX family permuted papain-like enzyme [Croceimicrobium sp.]|uniref:YiiX family permuted papain-like enzyme n=1 Tax=Croceimicrobium sp. TaxID=2828340 RepID=UPI003BA8E8D4